MLQGYATACNNVGRLVLQGYATACSNVERFVAKLCHSLQQCREFVLQGYATACNNVGRLCCKVMPQLATM